MALSIFAPTTGTFAPGNDVIGFATGSDLPAELSSWEPYGAGTGNQPTAATIWYNSQYNPSNTYSQVKFFFECLTTNPGSDQTIVRGVGMVKNATVSTTAIIQPTIQTSMNIAGSGGSGGLLPAFLHQLRNHASRIMFELGELDTAGDAWVGFYTNANGGNPSPVPSVRIDSTQTTGGISRGAVKTYDTSGNILNQI